MATTIADRVRKRREALRNAGLRPVQLWAPDSRKPGFAEECRRQTRLIADAEEEDRDLAAFLDAALEDVAVSGDWK
jgi:hypothetical protein